MKKIISIILVIVMAAAVTMPTFALSSGTTPIYADYSAAEGINVPVEYGVSNGFELLIPAMIQFNDETIGEGVYVSCTVAAINVVIGTGKMLRLTVSSASQTAQGTWELKVPSNDKTIADGTVNNEPVEYTVAKSKGGTALQNGNTVLEVRSLATDLRGVQELHCNTLGSHQSGTYEDYLTFTAQVVNAPQ